jgi:hypothetical protein
MKHFENNKLSVKVGSTKSQISHEALRKEIKGVIKWVQISGLAIWGI